MNFKFIQFELLDFSDLFIEKENYVLVLQPQEARIMEENLQIPSSLELLQDSIKTQRESESQTPQSKWGRRRRADNMWAPNENVPRTSTSAGDELWNFLRPHVAPILATV